MSNQKSQEELKESERVLRRFLSELEDQIQNDPSSKGKKADFRNNLVRIPSSVQKPDPKTGAPIHIITTSQVPLFYQLVDTEQDTEEESSKPEDNMQNFGPYYTSGQEQVTEQSTEKANKDQVTEMKSSKKEKEPKKKKKNGEAEQKPLIPQRVEVTEEACAQFYKARQGQGRKNACIEACNTELESKLKSLVQKTQSEEEIERNVQSLLEKYEVSKICDDLKKIEKKNTKRDMLLKKAELCRMECDKLDPTNTDKRNKGGSEFASSSKEPPPIFVPSEFRRIEQCDPNKLHFFLYK